MYPNINVFSAHVSTHLDGNKKHGEFGVNVLLKVSYVMYTRIKGSVPVYVHTCRFVGDSALSRGNMLTNQNERILRKTKTSVTNLLCGRASERAGIYIRSQYRKFEQR